MKPRIEILDPKKLIGIRKKMSLTENTTAVLWRDFMSKRSSVKNRVSTEYFSMQVYGDGEKELFSPKTLFEKWAAVEVSTDEVIPDGMESYSLCGGKYAVFNHKGPAAAFPKTMHYIMTIWLPESEYELDNREYFELLLEGYDPLDPEAEEEVWIPIKIEAIPDRS